MSIFTPVNQIRLTNVAVVRLRKGGKRWEIACYPNKVLAWRQGLESDIDEVVQSHEIFTNVSKGIVANKDVLQKAFKQSDQEKILVEILKKGEIQVTSKERQAKKETVLSEIVTIIADKCVNSKTQLPLTHGFVERALKEMQFNVNPNKTAKVQALEAIATMEETMPVKRAQMRVRVELVGKDAKAVAEKLEPMFAGVESREFIHPRLVLVGFIEPKNYRKIEEATSAGTRGKGHVTLLELAVQ